MPVSIYTYAIPKDKLHPELAEALKEGRVERAPTDEQRLDMDNYGYVFRLYRKKGTSIKDLNDSARDISSWAISVGAFSNFVQVNVHQGLDTSDNILSYNERDYAILSMTDPVAVTVEMIIEKQELKKERQKRLKKKTTVEKK